MTVELSTKELLIAEARRVGTRYEIGPLGELADFLEGNPVRRTEDEILSNALRVINRPPGYLSNYTQDDLFVFAGLLKQFRFEQILAQAEEIKLPGVTVAEGGRTASPVVDARNQQMELALV